MEYSETYLHRYAGRSSRRPHVTGIFRSNDAALYKIDFSDVPSIIAPCSLMGPASAAWVEIIKIIIKLITVGHQFHVCRGICQSHRSCIVCNPNVGGFTKRREDPPGSNRVIGCQRPPSGLCSPVSAMHLSPYPFMQRPLGLPLNQVITMVAAVQSGHQRSDHLHLFSYHSLQPD